MCVCDCVCDRVCECVYVYGRVPGNIIVCGYIGHDDSLDLWRLMFKRAFTWSALINYSNWFSAPGNMTPNSHRLHLCILNTSAHVQSVCRLCGVCCAHQSVMVDIVMAHHNFPYERMSRRPTMCWHRTHRNALESRWRWWHCGNRLMSERSKRFVNFRYNSVHVVIVQTTMTKRRAMYYAT